MTFQQVKDLQMMAEAVLRRRLQVMRRNGESGGGGPSLENVILIAGAVIIGLAVIAWITVEITKKEKTVSP